MNTLDLNTNVEAVDNLLQAFADNDTWPHAFVAANGMVYGPQGEASALRLSEMNKVEVKKVTREESLELKPKKAKSPLAPEGGTKEAKEVKLPTTTTPPVEETEEAKEARLLFEGGIQKLKDAKVNHMKIKAIKTQEQLDTALAALVPANPEA